MAHLQLTALAGGAGDEMEEVALLGSYDVEAGPVGAAEGEGDEEGERYGEGAASRRVAAAQTSKPYHPPSSLVRVHLYLYLYYF